MASNVGFQIINDWVYYCPKILGENSKLVKVPLDGSEPPTEICGEYVWFFYQIGEKLLLNIDQSIYTIDFNGSNKTLIYNFKE